MVLRGARGCTSRSPSPSALVDGVVVDAGGLARRHRRPPRSAAAARRRPALVVAETRIAGEALQGDLVVRLLLVDVVLPARGGRRLRRIHLRRVGDVAVRARRFPLICVLLHLSTSTLISFESFAISPVSDGLPAGLPEQADRAPTGPAARTRCAHADRGGESHRIPEQSTSFHSMPPGVSYVMPAPPPFREIAKRFTAWIAADIAIGYDLDVSRRRWFGRARIKSNERDGRDNRSTRSSPVSIGPVSRREPVAPAADRPRETPRSREFHPHTRRQRSGVSPRGHRTETVV